MNSDVAGIEIFI